MYGVIPSLNLLDREPLQSNQLNIGGNLGLVNVSVSQSILFLFPHLLAGWRKVQHLDEILLVSDIPGSSIAWPAPVTLPGLEMFPLLLIIDLLTQLTQVLLLSHLA